MIVPIPIPTAEWTTPPNIIPNSKLSNLWVLIILEVPKVANSANMYIMPSKIVKNHLYLPQQLFNPINAEIINVIIGSKNHKYSRAYPIASEGVVKNQKKIIAIAHIPRYEIGRAHV